MHLLEVVTPAFRLPVFCCRAFCTPLSSRFLPLPFFVMSFFGLPMHTFLYCCRFFSRKFQERHLKRHFFWHGSSRNARQERDQEWDAHPQ